MSKQVLPVYAKPMVDLGRGLEPSARGELEITDLNRWYLRRGELHVELLGRGMAWLDTGTHDSLLQAANVISTIENRQGMKIACLEEIAYHAGWIDAAQVEEVAAALSKTGYGDYLRQVVLK